MKVPLSLLLRRNCMRRHKDARPGRHSFERVEATQSARMSDLSEEVCHLPRVLSACLGTTALRPLRARTVISNLFHFIRFSQSKQVAFQSSRKSRLRDGAARADLHRLAPSSPSLAEGFAERLFICPACLLSSEAPIHHSPVRQQQVSLHICAYSLSSQFIVVGQQPNLEGRPSAAVCTALPTIKSNYG